MIAAPRYRLMVATGNHSARDRWVTWRGRGQGGEYDGDGAGDGDDQGQTVVRRPLV